MRAVGGQLQRGGAAAQAGRGRAGDGGAGRGGASAAEHVIAHRALLQDAVAGRNSAAAGLRTGHALQAAPGARGCGLAAQRQVLAPGQAGRGQRAGGTDQRSGAGRASHAARRARAPGHRHLAQRQRCGCLLWLRRHTCAAGEAQSSREGCVARQAGLCGGGSDARKHARVLCRLRRRILDSMRGSRRESGDSEASGRCCREEHHLQPQVVPTTVQL